jgi:hypothetical protein
MFNAQGKPRYWLGSYDAWHLVIPVALIAVLGAWALMPKPVAPRRTVAPTPPPLTPSTIMVPAAGSTLTVRQFNVIRGNGHPQARVFLFLRQIPNPEQLLGETRSGTNGMFQFTMAPFPPGDYGFRVETVAADGRRSPSPEISVRLTPEPPPAAPKKAPASQVTPKTPAKKAPPAKAVPSKQGSKPNKATSHPARPKQD